MIERQALGLECQYCDREFGLLVLSSKGKEHRMDIRRMLHDYRCFAVCSDCAGTIGKVIDQPNDNTRYVRVRNNE